MSLAATTRSGDSLLSPIDQRRLRSESDASDSVLRTDGKTDNKRLQLNQAAVRGVCHSFGAAIDIELGEDAFHMRFHRPAANKERRTDLFVAFSLSHELKHIDFALAHAFAA